MLNRLEEIKTRFKDLEVMMTKPEIISNQVQMTKISKEYRNLENVNLLWNSYQNISNEINENEPKSLKPNFKRERCMTILENGRLTLRKTNEEPFDENESKQPSQIVNIVIILL